jgi:hypothetical protein
MLWFPVIECWRKEVVNKDLRCLWKEEGGRRGARRRGRKEHELQQKQVGGGGGGGGGDTRGKKQLRWSCGGWTNMCAMMPSRQHTSHPYAHNQSTHSVLFRTKGARGGAAGSEQS